MVIKLSGFLNPLAFRLTAEKTGLSPSRYAVVILPEPQKARMPSWCVSMDSTALSMIVAFAFVSAQSDTLIAAESIHPAQVLECAEDPVEY